MKDKAVAALSPSGARHFEGAWGSACCRSPTTMPAISGRRAFCRRSRRRRRAGSSLLGPAWIARRRRRGRDRTVRRPARRARGDRCGAVGRARLCGRGAAGRQPAEGRRAGLQLPPGYVAAVAGGARCSRSYAAGGDACRARVSRRRRHGTIDFYGVIGRGGRGRERIERMIVDEGDLARHSRVIARRRPTVDLLVVYLHNHHWPADWMQPPSWMRDVAQATACGRRRCIPEPRRARVQGIELHRAASRPPMGSATSSSTRSNTKVRRPRRCGGRALMTFRFERAAARGAGGRGGLARRSRDNTARPDQGTAMRPDYGRGPEASAYLERWIERGMLPAEAWRVADGTARLLLKE